MDDVGYPLPPVPYGNPYAPAPEALSGAALQFTDPTDEISTFFWELLGYYVDMSGKVVRTKPLINVEGAVWSVGLVKSVSNSITTKSQLDNNEANAITLDMCDVFITAFMDRDVCRRFEILPIDRENITTRCRNIVKITAKRAIEGGFSDKKLLKGGITESSMRMDQAQQSHGILSKLFGGGKK